MKNLSKLVLFAGLFFCFGCVGFSQNGDVLGQLPPTTPGYTAWYVYDNDGDGIYDVLTKDEKKVRKFAKNTGSPVMKMESKSNEDIQVHVAVTDGEGLVVTLETVGTVHESGGKVLLPQ